MTLAQLIFAAMLIATQPPAGHSYTRVLQVQALADAIVEHHGAEDPWTLAALAVKETRARVEIVGKLGECGAMQVLGKYLRPRMGCADLATPWGSVIGARRAIGQWRAWAPADIDPWHCYAAGMGCTDGHGARATKRLFRWRDRLRASVKAAGAGIEALAPPQTPPH